MGLPCLPAFFDPHKAFSVILKDLSAQLEELHAHHIQTLDFLASDLPDPQDVGHS